MNRRELFIEFAESTMHVLDGSFGIDIPLERDASGRVTSASAEYASRTLREFFLQHGRMTPRVASCSIPARGVSLRRLSVPGAQKDELRRLLALQLEAQLPISPSELAWGCIPLRPASPGTSGLLQDFLVVAVKREFLTDYVKILADAGVVSEYTVGALIRRALCSNAPSEYSVLNSGRTRSELATFDARGPSALRVLPWGTENSANLNGSLQDGIGEKLFITSGSPSPELARHTGAPVEVIERQTGSGVSPANVAFRKLTAEGEEPVLLAGYEPAAAAPAVALTRRNWPALAIVLAVVAIGLRYAEPLIYRARLTRKLDAITAYRSTLPKIEKEFAFLHYIKTNQPPYIDTLAVLATAAPAGTKIDSLSLVRRGELSFRGSTEDAQAPGAFRSKLIDSGFFSRVVLDEQTPVQDGQKFNFRLSAQLKPDGFRKNFALPPTTNSIGTNTPAQK